MYIVLPAVSDDGSAIKKIIRDITHFSDAERECVNELWSDFLDTSRESPYRFCVCQDLETHQVLGFACYGKHALTESTYDLYWIAVDPSSQRSGVGSDLLFFVEEQIIAEKGIQLLVETSCKPQYQSARRFYRHNKYHQVALVRDFYSKEDHLIMYAKYLKHPREETNPFFWSTEFEKSPDFHIRWGQKRYS